MRVVLFAAAVLASVTGELAYAIGIRRLDSTWRITLRHLSGAFGFIPSAAGSLARPSLALAAKRSPVKKGGKSEPPSKPKSSWEVYTEGEYGSAFKFGWETAPTDKTAIGHALPLVVGLGWVGWAINHPPVPAAVFESLP